MKLFNRLLILLLASVVLNAYESEEKLKTVIIGKVAKYISWDTTLNEKFIITVCGNEFGTLFDDIYRDKFIKSKPVEIRYIDKITELQETNILFISQSRESMLQEIVLATKDKNILTISDSRGFAQKEGALQLYFVGQKLKLKMNTDVVQDEGFKVDRALLRVVEIVKRDDYEN